jgi:hypothetical protein
LLSRQPAHVTQVLASRTEIYLKPIYIRDIWANQLSKN